jgi:hypothetical protein
VLQGPGSFNFAFDQDDRLTLNDFKRLIVEESATFRAEKALSRRLRAEKVAASGGAGSGADADGKDDDEMTDAQRAPPSRGVAPGAAAANAAPQRPSQASRGGIFGSLGAQR